MARREPRQRSFPGIRPLKVCIPQGREEMELNGCSSHQRGSTRYQSDFNIPVNASAKVIRAWDRGFRVAYCLIREKPGDFPAWIAGSEIMSLSRSASWQAVRSTVAFLMCYSEWERQDRSVHSGAVLEDRHFPPQTGATATTWRTTERADTECTAEWSMGKCVTERAAAAAAAPYVLLQRCVCIVMKQQLLHVPVSAWHIF